MAKGLSLQEALRLTARLGSDAAFRERFASDTPAALAELQIDPAALGSCTQFQSMPSEEHIRDAHDALVGRLLTAHLAHEIHNFTS